MILPFLSGRNTATANEQEPENLFEKRESGVSQETTESLTTSKIMQMLDSENLINEIFFRYCHEINKITFWLSNVRQTFNYLFRHKVSKAVIIFGCLILVKAKIRASFLYNSLAKRENKYKLARFEEFLNSRHYERTLGFFKRLRTQCTDMENEIRLSDRLMFFVKKYKLEEVLKGKISDEKYQKVMSSQLLGLIKEKFGSRSRNRKNDVRNEYGILFSFIKFG